MTTPLVSVIIPCYNHQEYVQECIQGIIDQDYKNIELIIIDDGSSDESNIKIREVLPRCESRFKRFEYRARSNKGLCATLNEAIEWCEGEFISPLASDDVLYNNKISMQVAEFLKKKVIRPDLVALYSGVEYIDEHGLSIKKRSGSGRFCGFREVILRSEFLPTPTFLVQRSSLIDVGGFNPQYKIEDFYIRLRLTDMGGIFFVLPDILVKYRMHDDNLSKKSGEIWSGVTEILTDYSDRKVYPKALAKSMMIQAHDLQTVSTKRGLDFVFRAVRQWPGVLVTKSMVRFLLKIIIPSKFYRKR